MLPRSRRLNRATFDSIRTSTLVVSNTVASLRFKYRSSETLGRFSAVVPRSVDSRAVVRNKWRRRIYSLVRETPDLKGIDGIFYIRIHKEIPYGDLARAIRELLSKAMKWPKTAGLER